MNRTDEINHELLELGSPLAQWPRSMPYRVPQGYFEGLVTSVAIGIQTGADPALSLPKTMPYTVPAGYFEQLPQAVMAAIYAEDEAMNLPAAAAPYAVPEGYFDSFAGNLMSRIKAEEAAATHTTVAAPQRKVIPLYVRVKPMRWAAALVAIIGLSVAGYHFYNGPQPAADGRVTAMLNKTDKGVIADYINQNIDDFDSDMLEENAVASNVPVTSQTDGLQNINNNDIQQYLEETGG